MSYSLSIRARSKQEAKEKVEAALAPYGFDSKHNPHCRDGASIREGIASRIDCFAEVPADKEMVVEAYGHSAASYGPEGVGDLVHADSAVKVFLVPAATV